MASKKIIEALKCCFRLIKNPEAEWHVIFKEYTSTDNILKEHLFPIIAISGILTFILKLHLYKWHYALCSGIFIIIAGWGGSYVTYKAARFFLQDKTLKHKEIASVLSIYTESVYIIFYAVSSGLGNGLISQVFFLINLYCIYLLYKGIYIIRKLDSNQKKNLFIITSLSVIFSPPLINTILTIIFNIPVLNI